MRTPFPRPVIALSLLSLAACQEDRVVAPPPLLSAAQAREPEAPPGVVTIGALQVWPYTGVNFTGAPQDPINLIFLGNADPRQIRAALVQLDGNRTAFGFPSAFPFDCTWSDAIGGVQTSYASAEEWVGSAMQLECGPYGPLRFHLRLFRQGDVTLGGVHFELLIPGTADHQVLSWELAEQLVTVDFVRSGLLGAAPASTAPINDAPTFRTIPAPIYNGVPVPLRVAIAGPVDNVSGPVGIGTDGRATILTLAGSVPLLAGEDVDDLVITYGQVVPKPFCASSTAALIRIDGPISLRQRAELTGTGDYTVNFTATGGVSITPIDGATGQPNGAPYRARILERHAGHLGDLVQSAFSLREQIELPPTGVERGLLHEMLQAGNDGRDRYTLTVDC
ncbi:MAG TPA: hypothetical protein VK922_01135 [Gemmatimonadaceae bacterium]|nr:hypothetical protein [Gemmatimonadaceae bacterium]